MEISRKRRQDKKLDTNWESVTCEWSIDTDAKSWSVPHFRPRRVTTKEEYSSNNKNRTNQRSFDAGPAEAVGRGQGRCRSPGPAQAARRSASQDKEYTRTRRHVCVQEWDGWVRCKTRIEWPRKLPSRASTTCLEGFPISMRCYKVRVG